MWINKKTVLQKWNSMPSFYQKKGHLSTGKSVHEQKQGDLSTVFALFSIELSWHSIEASL